ncbi:MAG: hypothetical protein AAF633_26615, partial [Chloroflexota bacterium]
ELDSLGLSVFVTTEWETALVGMQAGNIRGVLLYGDVIDQVDGETLKQMVRERCVTLTGINISGQAFQQKLGLYGASRLGDLSPEPYFITIDPCDSNIGAYGSSFALERSTFWYGFNETLRAGAKRDTMRQLFERPGSENVLSFETDLIYLIPRDLDLIEPEFQPNRFLEEAEDYGLELYISSAWPHVVFGAEHGNLSALMLHHEALDEVDKDALRQYIHESCLTFIALGISKDELATLGTQVSKEMVQGSAGDPYFSIHAHCDTGSSVTASTFALDGYLFWPTIQTHLERH